MNLPNRLTILRIFLIPVYLFALYTDIFPQKTGDIIAAIILIGATFTDWLDGYIARKYNLVTNFGKLMDPLADKLLVASALIAFVELSLIPAWCVIILIGREFLVTGFRMVALEQNIVIAAGNLGKAKTVTQFILIIILTIYPSFPVFKELIFILIILATGLCLLSAIEYIYVNRKILKM